MGDLETYYCGGGAEELQRQLVFWRWQFGDGLRLGVKG